jgi:DNA adenine methylase
MSMNKSPLRYPGGKTRACKVLEEVILSHPEFNITNVTDIVSPFFGGGSFEFYIQRKYNLNIIANDKFIPLYNFWITCKSEDEKKKLCDELSNNLGKITPDIFKNIRQNIMTLHDPLPQSISYFIINRCSFSGATLSGGFSKESSNTRFTQSSIDRINNLDLTRFNICNLDFEIFIQQKSPITENQIMFLDPPYYLEKASKLYGNNGDMHESFNHELLYNALSSKTRWIMTYNNCDFIKNLYKDFIIKEVDWKYGMNKTKKSSEIVIISI